MIQSAAVTETANYHAITNSFVFGTVLLLSSFAHLPYIQNFGLSRSSASSHVSDTPHHTPSVILNSEERDKFLISFHSDDLPFEEDLSFDITKVGQLDTSDWF